MLLYDYSNIIMIISNTVIFCFMIIVTVKSEYRPRLLRPLAHAVAHVVAMTLPIVWVSGWRYATTSQTVSDYITRLSRPSQFFSRMLKNMGRPGYEATL